MKFFTGVFLFFTSWTLVAQNPGAAWMQYAHPEEAGWSAEKLEEAQAYAEEIGSAAFLLIYDGKVVANWGETERRFMCHSVRKSLLSALYGIYVDQGKIDISKTLADLGIDDIHALSDQEKQAKISDLLKARSGVYHPAAYETESMKKSRPARDSHAPGTNWYYNNWDFNTLCHILMEHTEQDFFEDFKEKIADPIQMEDFRLMDCYYHLEAEHSQYPAYPFRMSARDLARIGQLFLQEGKWNDRQLISADWIRESTKSYSENTRTEGRGYAYMWWTGIYGSDPVNYSAQGVGNQAIIVYPTEKIVMVNRANTYMGKSVRTKDLVQLTEKVLAAKTAAPKATPELVGFPAHLSRYAGEYEAEGEVLNISWDQHRLKVQMEGRGEFYLIPKGENQLLIEDAHATLHFKEGPDGTLAREVSFSFE